MEFLFLNNGIYYAPTIYYATSALQIAQPQSLFLCFYPCPVTYG